MYNPHRARDSQPLHKDNSRIISRLKDSYRDGKCVIITGAGAGPQVWEWQENDKYGEDKSVMLGAVITKSWDPNNKTWVNNKLAWVLGVCANVENAFDETHIPLMQACIDTFATLANVMIRSELINTQHGTEYRNDFPNGVYYGNGKKPMGYENLL